MCEQHFVIFPTFVRRCTTCGEYIYKGKKFNARKEDVENETYLGIRIYRFYIKVNSISVRLFYVNSLKINCLDVYCSVLDVFLRFHLRRTHKVRITSSRRELLAILWLLNWQKSRQFVKWKRKKRRNAPIPWRYFFYWEKLSLIICDLLRLVVV